MIRTYTVNVREHIYKTDVEPETKGSASHKIKHRRDQKALSNVATQRTVVAKDILAAIKGVLDAIAEEQPDHAENFEITAAMLASEAEEV